MAVCTFFGHRDCPDNIYNDVLRAAELMINKYNIDLFMVGNSGKFDSIVWNILKELSCKYNFQYYKKLIMLLFM